MRWWGVMVALAACAAPPQQSPPTPVVQRQLVLVRIHLSGLPAPSWTCFAAHESGAVVERSGVGEILELELPPGPCSLRLQCGGQDFERPLHVHLSLREEPWPLDRQEGAGTVVRGRNIRSSASSNGTAIST